MKVYISGPITGLPIEDARLAFKRAFDAVMARGHEPVNPCELAVPEACPCPDVAGTDGSGSGHTWPCYMRKDIRALTDCDAILMLPGWQASHGARRELDVANTLGLTLLFGLDPSWVQSEHPAAGVVEDILAELAGAEAKFPDQHLPDGTGQDGDRERADGERIITDLALRTGEATWRHVVTEEVAEAFAETDPTKLRAELVQVAAMAVRWIRDIDEREVTAP